MTAIPPPPSWTVLSVLERAYTMARDNFPAFVTVTMVFAAVSLVRRRRVWRAWSSAGSSISLHAEPRSASPGARCR